MEAIEVVLGEGATDGAGGVAGVHDRGVELGVVEAEGVAEFVEGDTFEVDGCGVAGCPVPVGVELHVEFDGGAVGAPGGGVPGAGDGEDGAALGCPADGVLAVGSAAAGAGAGGGGGTAGELEVGAGIRPGGGGGLHGGVGLGGDAGMGAGAVVGPRGGVGHPLEPAGDVGGGGRTRRDFVGAGEAGEHFAAGGICSVVEAGGAVVEHEEADFDDVPGAVLWDEEDGLDVAEGWCRLGAGAGGAEQDEGSEPPRDGGEGEEGDGGAPCCGRVGAMRAAHGGLQRRGAPGVSAGWADSEWGRDGFS